MKTNLMVLPAVALAASLSFAVAPASACSIGDGKCMDAPGQNKGPLGAPLPLLGASFPGLAIGYGAYWLIRRRRNTT